MDTAWKAVVWRQFGAAIDMLGNAMHACPEARSDRSRNPQFWYLSYHTLFFLDYYLSETPAEFAPPALSPLPSWIPRG